MTRNPGYGSICYEGRALAGWPSHGRVNADDELSGAGEQDDRLATAPRHGLEPRGADVDKCRRRRLRRWPRLPPIEAAQRIATMIRRLAKSPPFYASTL